MSHDGETPILHKNITPTDTNEKLDRRHHGHIRKRWMFAGATVVVLPPSMRRRWIHAYGDDLRRHTRLCHGHAVGLRLAQTQ